VLVVPSIFLNPTLISPISASTLALLGGLFVLSLAWFIGRYPVVSAAQEDLQRVNKPEDVTSL
jgi:hypothetical protein